MPPAQSDRLALFIPDARCGGAERVTVNLLRAAAELGIGLDLLLGKATGSLLAEVPPDVRIIDFNVSQMRRAIPKVVGYLRRHRPRAVISQMTHVNVTFLIARALAQTKTPLVVVEQNHFSALDGVRHARPWSHYLARWLYPWAEEIVGVSTGVSRDVERSLGLPANRVRTIYNPIVGPDLLTRAEEPCPHPWLASGDRPVLITVGRLEPQKDHALLLRTFAIVRRTRDARLIIYGEGSQRPQLESLRRSLDLEADVDLPGQTGNPYAAMRRAALFVLSSRFEGLPTVLVEALACGCPVVSTNCPSGPDEILDHRRYGLLVPPEDEEALAASILQGLDQPWDRDALRRRGAEFSVAASLERYLSVAGFSPKPLAAAA